MRDVQATVNRLGQFQIDSINVVTRAHFLPLFSRLGAYDPGLLERAAHRPPRRLFEYWGHAASLIDVAAAAAAAVPDAGRASATSGPGSSGWPGRIRSWSTSSAPRSRARGPVSARELEVEEVRDRSNWGWNWSAVKTVLEWLFYCGEVTSAWRNTQFERVYDLPERVLPRPCWRSPRRRPRSR